jgi:predicted ATP-grasp superfamily ATP-dependent carboligase
MNDRAPVFVMNVYYTGIGIARNLRGLDAGVFGLTSETDAPGVHSRYFRRVYDVPNSRDEPDALCGRLLEIRKQHHEAPVIFPTRDADLVFLDRYESRLASHFRLPPGGEGRRKLMDKDVLAGIAREQGIAVPMTMLCASASELAVILRGLRMPVVLKPRSAHLWRQRGVWDAVGHRKAILAESVDAALREYETLASVSPEVLVQEFVAGDDTDIVVCCCYIDRNGRCLGYFTGRKLLQNPPLFGTGCVVETLPVPDVVDPSLRLLRACGYAGLAEVEYKRDAKTGAYVLIEVNPRHWDQHELGCSVGVNLTRIAYGDVIGETAAPVSPSYPDTRAPRWIAEREAIDLIAQRASRRLAALRGQSRAKNVFGVAAAALGDLRNVFRRPWRLGVVDWRDPVPGIILFARLAKELSRAALRRANWRNRAPAGMQKVT